MIRTVPFSVAATILAMVSHAHGQSFETIAPDAGFDYAVVQDISDNGQFALVSLQNSQTRPTIPFCYVLDLTNGTRRDLVDPLGRDLNALSLSADGSVVVGYVGGGPGGATSAFVWGESGFLEIGGLSGGNISYATGVSGDGSMVVGLTGANFGDPYQQGWRWTSTGGFVPLDDIGDDMLIFSSVQGVSADGTAVVGFGTIGDFDPDTDDFQRGAAWFNGGVMPTDLGILPNPFNVGIEGFAASADGSVVVGLGSTTNAGGEFINVGFRWTQPGGLQAILPPSGTPAIASSYIFDCSLDGNTLVGYTIAGGVSTWDGLVWTPGDGSRALRTILGDAGVMIPTNIRVRETFCSGDGTILGGWCYDTTTQKYFGYIARLSAGAPCDPDVNADGNVDQDDIACLSQAVGGSPECLGAGVDPDFNQDGNVDQDDIAALEQVVAGSECP
ncbi:MAG: hypothetical protein SFY69_01725 [Planctomycetota bacterium]|nr:hypothetical protein [Planctomycetota bacterium]